MANFIQAIKDAAANLAAAVETEMTLEDNRHTVKLASIMRIMAAGERQSGKPHSFSSAEAAVSTDSAYAAHLEQLRNAARDRIIARGGYDAAVAAARLQENLV